MFERGRDPSVTRASRPFGSEDHGRDAHVTSPQKSRAWTIDELIAGRESSKNRRWRLFKSQFYN